MAVTQGHGNPKWSRDETFLALDLYLVLKGQVPSPKRSEIIALSELPPILALPCGSREAVDISKS